MPARPRAVRLVSGMRQYPLLPGDWLVGRSAGAGIAIADALSSREHAVVRVSSEAILVEDLGSRNGTFVNDRKISEPTALLPGDLLRIGDTIFVLEVMEPDAEAAAVWREAERPVRIAGKRNLSDGETTLGDTLPAVAPPGPRRPVEPSPVIEPRTALLVVLDREWGASVQRAAGIHPNLEVKVVEPAGAVAAARAVVRGVLLLDVAAAAQGRDAIQHAWAVPRPRGPSLIAADLPEHEGAVLARQLGAGGYVRRGKSPILAVAQLRYHLQRADFFG